MRKQRLQSQWSSRLPIFALGLLSVLTLQQGLPAMAGSFRPANVDPWWRPSEGRVLVAQSPREEAGRPVQTKPAQMQAVDDLRSAGTAMIRWFQGEMAAKRHRKAARPALEPAQVDISKIPVISYEDLHNLLVPKYIAALPEADPWGHRYEYRLNTQDPDAEQIMAARTAGADGQFVGDIYDIGRFQPGDLNQDVVWEDGYFVRWPQSRPR